MDLTLLQPSGNRCGQATAEPFPSPAPHEDTIMVRRVSATPPSSASCNVYADRSTVRMEGPFGKLVLLVTRLAPLSW